MKPNRSQFGGKPRAPEPEVREEIKETFLELCDLLEQYSPPWYSDQLHEKAESVVRQISR
jgi:hypothetical protein